VQLRQYLYFCTSKALCTSKERPDGGDAAEVGAVPADDAAKEREIAAEP